MERDSGSKGLSQHDCFIEAAKRIGANEDEAAFKTKLAVIARQKPKDAPEPPKE